MKKILTLILFGCLLLGLSTCVSADCGDESIEGANFEINFKNSQTLITSIDFSASLILCSCGKPLKPLKESLGFDLMFSYPGFPLDVGLIYDYIYYPFYPVNDYLSLHGRAYLGTAPMLEMGIDLDYFLCIGFDCYCGYFIFKNAVVYGTTIHFGERIRDN